LIAAGRRRGDRRRSSRKAAADGYTILQANTNPSFSQTFCKNLGYDLEQDFTPVGRCASAFYIAAPGELNPVAAASGRLTRRLQGSRCREVTRPAIAPENVKRRSLIIH
jgi:hypothetical protein